MEIPQDSPTPKKRYIQEDSEQPSKKRSKNSDHESSQETSSNEIPSDTDILTKDNTSTEQNPPQAPQEPTSARLMHHLDTNDAPMTDNPSPPPLTHIYIYRTAIPLSPPRSSEYTSHEFHDPDNELFERV